MLEEQRRAASRRAVMGLVITLAAILLLGFFAVILLLSGDDGQRGQPDGPTQGPTGTQPPVPLQERLRRLEALESRLEEYQSLRERERYLRARDISGKLRDYAAVIPYELRLREEVLAAEGDGGRVDTPLTELERGEFGQLQERLQQEAKVLVEELDDVGVRAGLKTDPLGRSLLNHEDATARLAARREALLKTKP